MVWATERPETKKEEQKTKCSPKATIFSGRNAEWFRSVAQPKGKELNVLFQTSIFRLCFRQMGYVQFWE